MNLISVFITGLTTGGLTCLAMQGGLLTSVIANQKGIENRDKKKNNSFDVLDWLPVVMFLVAKLIAHAILGFMLGWLGSAITMSVSWRLTFQALTALFMLATAMNLLNVHPIFRLIAFQPPKFIQRRIRSVVKNRMLFAPALLGLMTIFIPCGVTQAMEVATVGSGNPLTGAGIMTAFVLGTWPLFSILGIATSRLSEMWNKRFLYAAAGLLIAMSFFGLKGVWTALGAPKNLDQLAEIIAGVKINEIQTNETLNGSDNIQEVTIRILSNGYNPAKIMVKKGIPVRLTLETNGTYSCASAFVLRKFGIQTQLGVTDKKVFTFTPAESGRFPYTCSMGMYRGILEVI